MAFPAPGWIRVSNVSPQFPCTGWTWMGAPGKGMPSTRLVAVDANGRYPALAVNSVVIARVPLGPGESRDLRLEQPQPSDPVMDYAVAREIASDPMRSVPKLVVEMVDGTRHEALPPSFESRKDWDPVMWRTQTISRWRELPVVVEGWFDVFSAQRSIEWSMRVKYGTTKPGAPIRPAIRRITAEFGHFAVVEDWESKGMRPAQQFGDRWVVELAGPSVDWFPGRALRIRGALLCTDGSQEQVEALQYRREGKPRGEVGGWDGNIGPFGVIPRISLTRHREFKEQAWRRLHQRGHEDDPRPIVHHPYAGQTGPGPEFGVIWGYAAHILGHHEPSLLHFVERDIDACFRRPCHFTEERTSRPIARADHPGCRTFSGLPHAGWGTDLLGLPNPIPWIGGYTEPDDQHRPGLAELFMFLMTREPALGATIHDKLELDTMAWWRGRTPKLGEGGIDNMGVVPRQWGRPLMVWCWCHEAGFPQAEALIRDVVDYLHRACAWQLRSGTAAVQVLSDRLYKYGWVEADNQTPIWSWWPWMEATVIYALRAADLLFDLPKAREMVLRAARTVVRHGFYEHGGRWHCAYSVRTRADGSALPASSYWPGDNTNPDVYTIQDWGVWEQCAPVAKTLLELEPDGPDAERCRAILTTYGSPLTESGAAHFAVR